MTSPPPKTRPDKYDDFSTREFAENSFAAYDRLREQGRLSWQPAGQAWLLTSYDDCARILRSPDYAELDLVSMWNTIGRKVNRDYTAVLKLLAIAPFQLEGERHAQVRKTVARAIAPFAARQDVFRRRVDAMLQEPLRRGGCDLADEFARDVLFQIFCDLMEVPEADRPNIRDIARLSRLLEATLGVRQRDSAVEVLTRAMTYLEEHVRRQVARGSDCLINAVYRELPAGEPEPITATATIVCVLLIMGNDALSSCITQGVRQLLGEDDGREQTPIPQVQWGEISDDVVRFVAPVDTMGRMMRKDDVVAECPFKAGTRFIVSAQAANHDPEHFGEKANEISSTPTGHVGLAFGAGAHLCVGNRMSRNIAKAVMEALAQSPRIRLAGKAQFTDGIVVRVLSSLPVTFG